MKKIRLFPVLMLLCLLFSQIPASAAPFSYPMGDLKEDSQLLSTMKIEAKAAILVDDSTQEILYAQNAQDKNYPASITKVMTALLVIESIDRGDHRLDEVVTIGDQVNYGIGEGGSTVGLKAGEQITLEHLLYCALTASANEACNALGQFLCGDVESFVNLMNRRAQELGMTGTHFVNTHGYHDDGHYTTAYDIYLMCHEAMQHPTFRTIVSTKAYEVPATNLSDKRELHETNALISTWRVSGYWYEYANGIKTGSTPEAGRCLASSATKDGKTLIAVVLGAENYKVNPEVNYFTESSRLLDWGFDSFSTQTLLAEGISGFPEVRVSLSAGANYVTVQPSASLEATLPNDIEPSAFQQKVDLPEEVQAPVRAGQKLGTVTVTYQGQSYGSADLLATSTVERSELLYRLNQVQNFFQQLWVKAALAAAGGLVLIFGGRRLLFGKRRSRYSASAAGRGSRYSGRRRK